MPLSAGDRLGGYELVSRLGSGGMGVVYRAHDPKLGRDVAIKVLAAKAATDPDRLRRFEQEARAASALDHPNIVTIHEIGETDDGQPFLVMQLVDGKSLRELIESKRLTLSETLSIATQVADGLSRAHRHGIIHRDLKPDNVMVNADGLVKILDFGLAKLAEPSTGSELATRDPAKPNTQEGRIVGTAHYMSPEQAQGETVDTRSDIFSFGAVLYEMVTGRRPFRGDNAVAVLAEIIRAEPERLSSINPTLPVDLEKIVTRALRKDPERRFQNAADMKVALAELSDELASGDALTAGDLLAYRGKRRSWWPVAAAAALGLSVAAIVVWMLTRPPDVPPPTVIPLTSDAGFEREPAISPDGRQLAFAKNGNIYVMLIGEGEAVPLTDADARDANPAWSPDGTRVAFLRHGDGPGHDVLEVPAVGGTPRNLGRANGEGHGLSYAPDGSQLTVVHRESGDERDAIFLLARETGEYRRLTAPPPNRYGDRLSKFSPGGAKVVFERTRRGPNLFRVGDIVLYDLASDETRVLVREPGMIYGVDFTPDGRHVIFTAGKSWDSVGFHVVPIDGGEPATFLPGEKAHTVSIARDVNRLVFERSLEDLNIWKISGPAADESTSPELVIGSTWSDGSAAMSPDGARIAFTSGRSGEWEIWLADADGSSPRQLTRIGGTGVPFWSPDGARIAFAVATGDNIRDISVIDADGAFAVPLTNDAFDNMGPQWSADGRNVYYVSFRPEGPQIWKVPSNGGTPERVVPNAEFPKPMENGDLLFIRDWMLFKLTDAGEVATAHRPAQLPEALWRDKIVFFGRTPDGAGSAINVFDLSTGTTSTLQEFHGGVGPDVSTDGQWIHYTRWDSEGTDVILVENFVP